MEDVNKKYTAIPIPQRARAAKEKLTRPLGQGIFWQTVCQLRLAIGKANCGTPHLPTRDG